MILLLLALAVIAPPHEYRAETIRIRSGSASWRFTVTRDVTDPLNGCKLSVFLNGRRNALLSGADLGTWFEARRVRVPSPHPIIAIRTSSADGGGQWTKFLMLRGRRAILMGEAPGESDGGGPVLWRGRKSQWLFDDHCSRWYAAGAPFSRYLFNIEESGRMKLIRKWDADKESPLPDTVARAYHWQCIGPTRPDACSGSGRRRIGS